MVKTPVGQSGIIPTIKPIAGGIDGSPLTITASSVASTNSVDGNCVYLISSTPVHFRLSSAATAATTNDPWIPADIPFLFYCELSDKVTAIKRSGAADGNLWVHACEQVD
jgi:hypothetical protein